MVHTCVGRGIASPLGGRVYGLAGGAAHFPGGGADQADGLVNWLRVRDRILSIYLALYK